MSNGSKNFYDELNLKKDCSAEDIKKSFIKLSKEFHPDKNSSKDSHERFVLINEAYTTLSKPSERKKYDHYLSEKKIFDFRKRNSSSDGPDGKYDYTSHQYTHRTNSDNSYSGSRILLRLAMLPKAVLFTALVLMTFFSTGLELYFLRNGAEKRRMTMENESILASVALERARHQAKLLGNEEQMRRLKDGKLGVYDNDVLFEEYKTARNSQRHNSK